MCYGFRRAHRGWHLAYKGFDGYFPTSPRANFLKIILINENSYTWFTEISPPKLKSKIRVPPGLPWLVTQAGKPFEKISKLKPLKTDLTSGDTKSRSPSKYSYLKPHLLNKFCRGEKCSCFETV